MKVSGIKSTQIHILKILILDSTSKLKQSVGLDLKTQVSSSHFHPEDWSFHI